MAKKSVFRITPRVSTTIRAIEAFVQQIHDQSIVEQDCPEGRMRAVFHYGDFEFVEQGDLTLVSFNDVEIMFTLLDDPEFFLIDYHYKGCVVLQKTRLEDGSVCYSTVRIVITLTEESQIQEEGAVIVTFQDPHLGQ